MHLRSYLSEETYPIEILVVIYKHLQILFDLTKLIHRSIDSLYHGTIIRTGITCKKIPFYMRDSACRWFIVKKAKIFSSYVKHF